MSTQNYASVFFGAVVNGVPTDYTWEDFVVPEGWGIACRSWEWEDERDARFGKPGGLEAASLFLADQPCLMEQFGSVEHTNHWFVYIPDTKQEVEWLCEPLNTDIIYGDPEQMVSWPHRIVEWCKQMDLHVVGDIGWQLAVTER